MRLPVSLTTIQVLRFTFLRLRWHSCDSMKTEIRTGSGVALARGNQLGVEVGPVP